MNSSKLICCFIGTSFITVHNNGTQIPVLVVPIQKEKFLGSKVQLIVTPTKN